MLAFSGNAGENGDSHLASVNRRLLFFRSSGIFAVADYEQPTFHANVRQAISTAPFVVIADMCAGNLGKGEYRNVNRSPPDCQS